LDNSSKKFDYKWIIISLCFLMVFVCLGFCSSNKSLYTFAITEALGISRSAFSVNDSFRYITTAVINLFFGFLVSKLGTKKMICAGFVCLIIAVLLYSVASSLIVFYIGGIFLGVGFSWTSTTMVGCVVNKWFSKNKGTIMGFVLAANGLGGALAVQIVSPLIYEEGNPFGYRNAYWITAAAVAVVMVIVAIFYKDKTHSEGNSETGKKGSSRRENNWQGFEYGELRKKPAFYAVIISLSVYALVSVGSISTPHFQDIGFSPKFVALLASIGSIGLAVSKILVGVLYDKFGLKVSVNICLFSALVGKLLLLITKVSATGQVLAISHSVLLSIATPLETVMISIVTMDLFGEKSFNKTLAITTSLFTIGHAINSPLLSLPKDFTNSYMISFVVSTVISAVVIVILNLSITSLKKDAKEESLTR